MQRTPLLSAKNITKKFYGITVLDNVDFDIYPGEVHALFGENGAGKSTFIKILCGGYSPNGGEIHIEGSRVEIKNPSQTRSLGIIAVQQDFGLIPQLSVVDNLYLGRELEKHHLLDKKAMTKQAESLFESLNLSFKIRASEKVNNLSMAEQQIVAIAKAFLQPMKILILDEPTSSFTQRETEMLFSHIIDLKKKGIGIIYISHVVDELKAIADRVTILVDGKVMGAIDKSTDITKDNLLKAMLKSKKSSEDFPEMTDIDPSGPTLVDVNHLWTKSGLQDISFHLKKGEILGIAGLPDSGKSLVGRALYGLEKIEKGDILVKGNNMVNKFNPSKALRNGIVYFPPEKLDAIALCRSIKENQTLPVIKKRFSRMGFIKKGEEVNKCFEQIERLSIKPNDLERTMRLLSGGNQQKVLFSRGLLKEAEIFVFDDITRGIDIASKIEFYKLVDQLAKKGGAVIYISSEASELLNLCHRVVVLYDKKIISVIDHKHISREKLLPCILGLRKDEEKN
jgi:ABC-type sugar transport system ATPase subunit